MQYPTSSTGLARATTRRREVSCYPGCTVPDRGTLGDYLSRRKSKVVLKAFIRCLGFGGVWIDKALRVFLQSLHLALPFHHSNPLDYVSNSPAADTLGPYEGHRISSHVLYRTQ